MQQNPAWEANNSSASQISHIFWHPQFHYRINKSPSSVPITNQINPVHAPFYF